GAAVDVVERQVVVDADAVELGDRQVLDEVPVLAAVPALVDAAVVAVDQVVGVVGVDPQRVVVDVLAVLEAGRPSLAAVLADVDRGVHRVDAVEALGVGHQLLVVLRARRDVAALLLPALAAVAGAEEAALVAGRLDPGIEHVGVDRRDAETDAAAVAFRQALLDLAPGLAAVGRL